MERFKKILFFPLEGTGERATLARAVELAKRNRARFTLVEVVEELPREVRMLITALAPADVRVGGPEVLGKSPGLLQPLHTPLVYAIDCSLDSALIPAPRITFGGPRVDCETGAVLRADGSASAGLYAAGRNVVGVSPRTR